MSSHHSNLGQESWPLDPPGNAQYEYMKRFLFAKLQEWKARLSEEGTQNRATGDDDQQLSDNIVREEAAYQQHFAQAYHNWQKLTQDHKQEQWRLECQRAYAEEYDRHQDTRDRLDQLEQEIHHLRLQLSQQKNGQLSPSSALEVSPITLSRSTMKSFVDQQARDLQHWDYDRLLAKWKQRVRQERSVQQPLPATTSWASSSKPANGASSGFEHGPSDEDQQQPYQYDGVNENEDEDLADAPGEDEDEDLMSTTGNVLDPTLRHDSGNVDDGGRMLMELKGFQGANGNGAAGC